MVVDNGLKEKIYIELGSFANCLNNLSLNHQLLSASTAASFIYAIREDIYDSSCESNVIYRKLYTAIKLIIKIEIENKKIINSKFWEELLALQVEIDTKRELSEVLTHLSTIKRDFLDIDLEQEDKKVTKNYIQIGRSDRPEHGNDIVFKHDKTLSRVHLVITTSNGHFFIEDRSANGTFINGVKIEKGIKCSVESNDEIRIGRKGTIIDINREEIQKLAKNQNFL